MSLLTMLQASTTIGDFSYRLVDSCVENRMQCLVIKHVDVDWTVLFNDRLQ